MSRLGKKPVTVPSGVDVKIDGRTVHIAKDDKRLAYEHRPEVAVAYDAGDKAITISIDEADAGNRQVRAYWGMTRALLQNMVTGVSEGYQIDLEVVGVGYSANVAGNRLDLKLGYANTIEMDIPEGVDVEVDRQFVRVRGADKQAVGQFAADVRAKRKPEPYNGKGVKYVTETIRRKQGKAFGA